MNNKKLALAVIAVLLVAGLIGAGIMAWFTSEQAIVGNLFEAGTLVIELDEETPAEALMKFENMQPGDVEEATATIKNAGTLPFKFYAIITEDSHVPGNDGAGSEGGYLPDMLVVTVTMQGGKVYEAPLSALLNQVLVYADDDGDPVTVDPDETADINIKVVFNTAAGNEYQNAAFTGTITFIATQVDNPTEWQIFTFEKEKETAVEFSTQGVEMKVKAGDDTNTVITVERYDTSTNPPPSDMDPAGIYLEISADPPLPEGSEVVLEVSYLPLPPGVDETELKLYRYNETTGQWDDLDAEVDTDKKVLRATLSGLSTFGIFYDAEAEPLPVYNKTKGLSYETIQAAVDDAAAGDTIELAAGKYTLMQALNLGRGLSLKGAGVESTTISIGHSENYAFPLTSNANLHLENITFKGTGKIGFRASSQTHVEKLEFINCAFEGFSFPIYLAERLKTNGGTEDDNRINEITIKGCVFNNTQHVYLGRGVVDSALIEGNTFAGTNQIGIEFYDCWTPRRTGQISFESNSFTNEYPIVLLTGGPVTINNTSVTYNQTSGNRIYVAYVKAASVENEKVSISNTTINGEMQELEAYFPSWGWGDVAIHSYLVP